VSPPAPDAPLVVLGAGYAGLTVAEEVRRRARGAVPLVLIDRHPVHVLRTELYELGRMVEAKGSAERWTVPLTQLLEGSAVEFRQGEVVHVDLDRKEIGLDSGTVAFSDLVIALGNVAAYYGVEGAREHTHSVYRLGGALALAQKLGETMAASVGLPGERRPRVVVVGGGSTGTEVAAEIATTDWPRVTGVDARPPDVVLVTGSVPFLAGLPPTVIARARSLLRRAGVSIVHGFNVHRVEPDRLYLEDGSCFAFDVAVWCAGLEAPPVVRQLSVAHGHAGRLTVDAHLELPGRAGVFAIGDVAEWTNPETGQPVPATAQVAIAQAHTAARNAIARWTGAPLVAYRYQERGVVVALGARRAAGRVGSLTLWSSPAVLLKRAVQREYARTARKGEPSGVL
jgi:NADH dehydrogenase